MVNGHVGLRRAWNRRRRWRYDRRMEGDEHHAWSTRTAAGLMGLLTVAFGGYAILALLRVDTSRVIASSDAALLGLNGQQETTVTVIIAAVILVVALLTLTLTLGVARRREGARHAAMLVFGTLAVLSLAAALPGLTARPPRPGAGYGLLVGMLDAAVVVLLALPATADDVDTATRARERRAVSR